MAQEQHWKTAFLTLVVGVVIGAVVAVSIFGAAAPDADPAAGDDDEAPSIDLIETEGSVQQLGSADAFHEYVRKGQQKQYYGVTVGGFGRTVETFEETDVAFDAGDAVAQDGDGADGSAPSGSDDRIGTTNVQVAGLDEPDLVKTDGSNFYYAPSTPRYHTMIEPDRVEGDERVPPKQPDSDTHVIDTSDPAAPAAIANISANGKLLQTGDRLIIFDTANSRIVGFDVSDPANPIERWSQPLDDPLVTARETGGQLFVVTQTQVGPDTPCPIEPLGADNAVACGEVFAPQTQTTADATYTAFSIDAQSGTVDDSVSMMGTGQNTVVYMSNESLYLTYTTGPSESDLRAAWASESSVVPQELADRIQEINSYNISERSKRTEIELAVQDYVRSLPDDEREQTAQEIREDFQDYLIDRQEKLTQTTVVDIAVEGESLTVSNTGTVPGKPLNQFALDEYQGTLRVTTTIPRTGDAASYNNLYVLDSNTLEQEDQVTGMGEDQRVYAVRYVDDRAYVVTFRQVDPFYVINFEEPRNPELQGKLKLPGYSDYLHPVNDDYVIGIGEEDWNVKAALFDVSDPTDPKVADDMKLPEGWSAVSQSHHAFMMDTRHEVFFLPAGNTGRVVDYTGGELETVKKVQASANVERARYVGDYLYVFAGQEVIVLDQSDWERESTLALGN
jgi:inhibitor of cysteine peptidase